MIVRKGLRICCHLIFAAALMTVQPLQAGVSGAQRIDSAELGYALQYWVYLPVSGAEATRYPVLYLVDGAWYLENGRIDSVLDRLIKEQRIQATAVVLVDSRNPDDPGENRRNSEFMCNDRYARFFALELIPEVERQWPVSGESSSRVIGGLSFGALNAACFGLMLPNVFHGLAMQSPASARHVEIMTERYRAVARAPLKMFISVGDRRDNRTAVRRFRRALEQKGYPVEYREVAEGHDWDNWGPLQEVMLETFFAPQ